MDVGTMTIDTNQKRGASPQGVALRSLRVSEEPMHFPHRMRPARAAYRGYETRAARPYQTRQAGSIQAHYGLLRSDAGKDCRLLARVRPIYRVDFPTGRAQAMRSGLFSTPGRG